MFPTTTTPTPSTANEPHFFITSVSATHILSNPTSSNTNNHAYTLLPSALQSHEPPITPTNYSTQIHTTRFSLWRPILTSMQPLTPPGGTLIPLPLRTCRTLLPGIQTGMQTGRIPEIEREDMEAAFLPLLAPHFLTGERYFVRLDECSSKDGIGGMGPFSDPSEVLRSLGTSVRAYKALVRGVELGTGEMLHLVPWRDDVCTANEFRMFVPPHGRVQAISQYTARYAGWGERLLGSAGDRVVRGMLECHEEFRRRAGENVPAGGYVLDLHVTGAETDEVVVEPVELNSFGAQLASGSGLFHWLEDWKRMYGMEEDGRVEIRVVAE